jgi:competence protein ComEA
MAPFPADWRSVGTSVNTATEPLRRHHSETQSGARAIERGHFVVAVLASVAVGAGVLAIGATLWLATPHGSIDHEVGVTSRAAAPAANGVQVALGPVVQRSSASTFASPIAVVSRAELVIDVEGGIRHPGILRLAAGSRVGEAIAAAGGYGARADLVAAGRTLNLAQPLHDGAKLRIPTVGDTAGSDPVPQAAAESDAAGGALIDLNHADEGQLESLPGVGPVTAGRIIDARTAAPFATIEDVAARAMVGPSTLERLRPLVTVTP